MSALIIDEKYHLLKQEGHKYVLEGHQEFIGEVHIKIPLKIDGDLVVRGDLTSDYFLEISGNELVEGDEQMKQSQTVKGNQTISGMQMIGGDQSVYGNQSIGRTQYVGGDQTVKGSQTAAKGKFIAGVQDVRGKMTLFNRESDFSIEMYIEDQEIVFMRDLINISGECHSPKVWEEYPLKGQMRLMPDSNSLQWWKRWKAFILTTHLSLALGHEEETD